MSFGRSVRDKFTLVLRSSQVGSLISSREYEKPVRTRLFSKSSSVCIFWFLMANGGGELFFIYKVSCSGMMNLKARFCSKLFTL